MLDKDFDAQEQLTSWSIDYDVSNPLFLGYTETDNSLAGRCKYRTDSNGIRYGAIQIRPELSNHPYLAKSVLWHEFNHHAVWYLYNETGHGGKWFKRELLKPTLVVGEFLAVFLLGISNGSYIYH